MDFGLKVNPTIDERRHIVEASRGAAKYLVQSNAYYKNWINTMVSYYMGFTGAKAYARPADTNSKNMLITDQTHVYFLTFLAHKIAFENAVREYQQPTITLREMRANPGQSLGEIALATKTDPVELEKYNKWLLGGNIPHDKDYTVLIPVASNAPVLASNTQELTAPVFVNKKLNPEGEKATITTVNGLKAIIAKAGDTKDKLALQAKISTRRFLKLNDMYSFTPIIPGQVYYLEKKYTRGKTEYHVAQPGETLLSIAQQHGIRLKSILSKNRMKKNEALVAGRVLWLQHTRPANIAVEYRRIETPVVPKNPQPLVAQVNQDSNTDARKDETVLASIKETASSTFQKAGAALNIPEKQPEVARVGGDVFEETFELNPTAKKETTAPKESITEENLTSINETTEPVKEEIAATQETKKLAVVPEPTQTETTKATEQAAAKTTEITINETPAEKEEAAALYPAKTVAKTEQKVVLKEPVETNQAETETEEPETAPEAVAVKKPEQPKVILKEPVTAPAPKTVSVPDKKPAKETVVAAKPTTHKVAKGETLYAISKKYNVTPSDLKHWNQLGEKPLAIGQELKVTGEPQPVMPVLTVTGPDKPVAEGTVVNITHRVGEGESMYQISRKYGVSIKEIMEWNNKADFNVSAGDELLIRSRPGSSRN